MLTADELAKRLLAELEEFHNENILTMLNTLFDPRGQNDQIPLMKAALRQLVEDGYVCVISGPDFASGHRTAEVKNSLAIIAGIGDVTVFDTTTGWWSEIQGLDASYQLRVAEIVFTHRGLLRARELLKERGYRWWEHRNDDEPGQ